MTSLTDYMLSALAVALGVRLWRAATTEADARYLWAGALWSLALGALAGGTYHGFEGVLSPAVEELLWTVTMVAAGAAGLLLLGAAVVVEWKEDVRRWLSGIAIVVFAVYTVWVCWFDNRFLWAVVIYGSSMALVLLFHLGPAVERRPGSRAIVAGVLVSFLGGWIQQAELAPSPSFDHNDLFHVVQMAGTYLFYRGASAGVGA